MKELDWRSEGDGLVFSFFCCLDVHFVLHDDFVLDILDFGLSLDVLVVLPIFQFVSEILGLLEPGGNERWVDLEKRLEENAAGADLVFVDFV